MLIKPKKLGQIVRLMVVGLTNPSITIHMGTFGHRENDKCYGCVATCALIAYGADPALLPTRQPGYYSSGFAGVYRTCGWIDFFEGLVDNLRQGAIYCDFDMFKAYLFNLALEEPPNLIGLSKAGLT